MSRFMPGTDPSIIAAMNEKLYGNTNINSQRSNRDTKSNLPFIVIGAIALLLIIKR